MSLITKASSAPLLPIYGLYWLKKHPRKLPQLLIIPAVMLLFAFPFHPHLDLVSWLVQLYMSRILPGESNFITVIAFNFWNLVFGPHFLPANTPFLGVPANLIGWTIVGVILIVNLKKLWLKTDPENFLYVSTLLFFPVFLFAPKMLQRYLFPVFPLLSASMVLTQKKSNWFILGIISVCYIINLYYQWWAPGISLFISVYTPVFTQMISLIYLSAFITLHVKKN
jgi:hypothetical protein